MVKFSKNFVPLCIVTNTIHCTRILLYFLVLYSRGNTKHETRNFNTLSCEAVACGVANNICNSVLYIFHVLYFDFYWMLISSLITNVNLLISLSLSILTSFFLTNKSLCVLELQHCLLMGVDVNYRGVYLRGWYPIFFIWYFI